MLNQARLPANTPPRNPDAFPHAQRTWSASANIAALTAPNYGFPGTPAAGTAGPNSSEGSDKLVFTAMAPEELKSAPGLLLLVPGDLGGVMPCEGATGIIAPTSIKAEYDSCRPNGKDPLPGYQCLVAHPDCPTWYGLAAHELALLEASHTGTPFSNEALAVFHMLRASRYEVLGPKARALLELNLVNSKDPAVYAELDLLLAKYSLTLGIRQGPPPENLLFSGSFFDAARAVFHYGQARHLIDALDSLIALASQTGPDCSQSTLFLARLLRSVPGMTYHSGVAETFAHLINAGGIKALPENAPAEDLAYCLAQYCVLNRDGKVKFLAKSKHLYSAVLMASNRVINDINSSELSKIIFCSSLAIASTRLGTQDFAETKIAEYKKVEFRRPNFCSQLLDLADGMLKKIEAPEIRCAALANLGAAAFMAKDRQRMASVIAAYSQAIVGLAPDEAAQEINVCNTLNEMLQKM